MDRDNPGSLPGFSEYRFPDDGRTVYWRGEQGWPGLVLLHELPGMVPECVDLARELSTPSDAHQPVQVHMPLLFGRPEVTGGVTDMARWMWCMRREMSLLSRSTASPLTTWVAALAREVAERTGQPRVAVIGMCLTGSLVFGLVTEPHVGPVVASQPSLPMGLTPGHRRDLGVPLDLLGPEPSEGSPVLAMRYRQDQMCPRARVEGLAEAYGSRLPEARPDETQDVQLPGVRIVDIPGRRHALLTIDRNEYAVETVRGFLDEHLAPDRP